MITYYSIISFCNNRVSEEKIAIGLIMFDGINKPIYRLSQTKLDISMLLNLEISTFFKMVMTEDSIFGFKEYENILEEINRRHQTEQGILNYSMPKIFNANLDQRLFDQYFDKWILNKNK